MGNLYSMLKQQESIIDEPLSVGVRWGVGERIRAINESCLQLNRELHVLQDVASFSTVAYQRDYNLPRTQDNFSPVLEDVLSVVFDPGTTHVVLESTSLRDIISRTTDYATPGRYVIFPREGKLKLDPVPSAAATATTLNGNITAAATSMVLTSVTDFPTEGRLIIGSEVISWDYVNTTTKTLSGCVRGIEGTTAATHSSLDAVTWRNVMVYYVRRPDPLIRAYYTGTAAVTNGDATVTLTTGVTTNTILAGDYFGTGIKTPGDPERYYRIGSVTAAATFELAETWQEATASSVAYGIGQPSPFPAAYDDAVVSLSCMKLLAKDDDPKVVMCKQFYEEFVHKFSKDSIPDDYLVVSGKRRWSGRQGQLQSGSWDGF